MSGAAGDEAGRPPQPPAAGGSPDPQTEHGRRVPDVVAPPPGNPRFPLFDSVRAIAMLGVILVHTMGAAGATGTWYGQIVGHMSIGLTLFFITSAFLLYRPFYASRAGTGPRIRAPDYAWRRVLRIVPAYWLALTVISIYPGLHGPFSGDFWAFYGFVWIYQPVYHLQAACGQPPFDCGIVVAWSLAVEVTFYAILPFFSMLMARWAVGPNGPRRELLVLGGLALASIGVVTWGWYHPGARYLIQTLPGTFLWLATGMALAIASVQWDGLGRRRPAVLSWLAERSELVWGAALLLWSLAVIVGSAATVGYQVFQYTLYGVVGALFVLPAAFPGRRHGLPRRVLANPVLAWIGLITYGIFLYHFPIAYKLATTGILDLPAGLRFPVLSVSTALLAIGCAAASYYVLERPILRLKNRPPWRLGRRRREARSAG